MKLTTHRHKLSAKALKLPSAYRTTAWAEVSLPPVDGHGVGIEIARFHSSTPGHVEVFAKQDSLGKVTEITEGEFQRLLIGGKMPHTHLAAAAMRVLGSLDESGAKPAGISDLRAALKS